MKGKMEVPDQLLLTAGIRSATILIIIHVCQAYTDCTLGYSYYYSGYLYSASSSQLLLRGALDTARTCTLCRSFMPKRHRQLRVKDLLKFPTWRLLFQVFVDWSKYS